MIIDSIIPLQTDPVYNQTHGYVSTVLIYGDGKAWVGDINRKTRTIEIVEYTVKDFTDRSAGANL